jgi:hypothetical protein
MYSCEKTDMDFFDRASACYVAEVRIRATPERIFEVFENAHAWTVWALPITGVQWTSPRPFGVGTTRTVHMMGGMIGVEEFIAWESGKRMAFCFTECSKPNVRAFAEDYEVEDKGDGTCSVRWKMALEANGIGRVFLPLTGLMMQPGLQWMLGRFKAHVEAGR